MFVDCLSSSHLIDESQISMHLQWKSSKPIFQLVQVSASKSYFFFQASQKRTSKKSLKYFKWLYIKWSWKAFIRSPFKNKRKVYFSCYSFQPANTLALLSLIGLYKSNFLRVLIFPSPLENRHLTWRFTVFPQNRLTLICLTTTKTNLTLHDGSAKFRIAAIKFLMIVITRAGHKRSWFLL